MAGYFKDFYALNFREDRLNSKPYYIGVSELYNDFEIVFGDLYPKFKKEGKVRHGYMTFDNEYKGVVTTYFRVSKNYNPDTRFYVIVSDSPNKPDPLNLKQGEQLLLTVSEYTASQRASYNFETDKPGLSYHHFIFDNTYGEDTEEAYRTITFSMINTERYSRWYPEKTPLFERVQARPFECKDLPLKERIVTKPPCPEYYNFLNPDKNVTKIDIRTFDFKQSTVDTTEKSTRFYSSSPTQKLYFDLPYDKNHQSIGFTLTTSKFKSVRIVVNKKLVKIIENSRLVDELFNFNIPSNYKEDITIGFDFVADPKIQYTFDVTVKELHSVNLRHSLTMVERPVWNYRDLLRVKEKILDGFTDSIPMREYIDCFNVLNIQEIIIKDGYEYGYKTLRIKESPRLYEIPKTCLFIDEYIVSKKGRGVLTMMEKIFESKSAGKRNKVLIEIIKAPY